MTPEYHERFMALTKEVDGHLLWIGATHKHEGREDPIFHVPASDATGGRSYASARRAYWEMLHGEVPEALVQGCEDRMCLSCLRPRRTQPERIRRRNRQNSYARAAGRGRMVPVAPVQEHLRWLIDSELMSVPEVAGASGVAVATINEIRRSGRRSDSSVHRHTSEALLAVKPTEFPGDGLGPLVDSTGTVRRIQAMIADGIDATYLTRQLGLGSKYGEWMSRMARGRHRRCYAQTVRRIRDLYDKLDGCKAEELMPDKDPRYITRGRNSAAKAGYAPRHCWDADTIDDPDAIPEWTGECGTEAGYRIHQREGHRFRRPDGRGVMVDSPACLPCARAHFEYNNRYKEAEAKQRLCVVCEGPLPEGSNHQRLYCSNACRQSAYDARTRRR